MSDDDRPAGRLLTRRELVALFGAAAAAAMVRRGVAAAPARPALPGSAALEHAALAGAPDCVALPQQTEGPFFVDERLLRSDIRPDPSTGKVSPGAALDLRFVVSQVTSAGACVPLAGAQVDVWHCDAAGVYSDVRDRSGDSTGQKFLRGHQISDAGGHVRFTTIYPGWYAGRAVHIHFKIRVPAAGGRADEFTSQLYFADDLTDRVHARQPYAAKPGQRILNARDGIFRDGGSQLLLPVSENRDGYAASFTIAMRPGELAPTRFGGRRRSPRG